MIRFGMIYIAFFIVLAGALWATFNWTKIVVFLKKRFEKKNSNLASNLPTQEEWSNNRSNMSKVDNYLRDEYQPSVPVTDSFTGEKNKTESKKKPSVKKTRQPRVKKTENVNTNN